MSIIKSEKKKLWEKGSGLDLMVETFTTGKDKLFDQKLARHDVIGSMAHALMLYRVDLINEEEKISLVDELRQLYRMIEKNGMVIEDGVEDIHSQVELILTRKLGDVGKKIHTGRSRNDQVLLDLKLYFRDEIVDLTKKVKSLFDVLINLSETHKKTLLPGYTHMQAAMPSSFGLWFAAYAESLIDDMILMQAVYKIINKNPLGTAAGYGSSFPLNRQLTTELLGFGDMNYNSVYAQMGRGKTERLLAQALSSFAATIGKLAMDICLFNSQNFDFVQFPDSLTTGSSIMPHKKNPDVFELIRAKCNSLQALPNTIALASANLPSGYHRDWQVLKEHLFPALEDMHQCLEISAYALTKIKVNTDIMEDSMYDLCFSVDAVNEEVKKGMSFREAYHRVAESIAVGKFERPRQLDHTHEGSIGNLCNKALIKNMDSAIKKFNFKKALQAIEGLLKS